MIKILIFFACVITTLSFISSEEIRIIGDIAPNETILESKHITIVSNFKEKSLLEFGSSIDEFCKSFISIIHDGKMAKVRFRLFQNPNELDIYYSNVYKVNMVGNRSSYCPVTNECCIIIDNINGCNSIQMATVRHESVHAMVRMRYGKSLVPTWYNEGLATYFEAYDINKSLDENIRLIPISNKIGRVAGYTKSLKSALSTSSIPSFKTLYELSPAGFYSKDIKVEYLNYSVSWGFIAAILKNKDGVKLLSLIDLGIKNGDKYLVDEVVSDKLDRILIEFINSLK